VSEEVWYIAAVPGLDLLPAGAPPYAEAYSGETLRSEYQRLGNQMLENLTEGYMGLEPAERIDNMRAALEAPVYYETLERAWPVVLVLMYTEFDTVTPGKRGIGRMTTANPRFGATFRRELSDPATRSAMTPLAERLVIGGYLGQLFAAADSDGPLPNDQLAMRERTIGDLAPRWFYDIHNRQEAVERNLGNILSVALEDVLDEWEACAKRQGLISGIRKEKARRALRALAFYYLSAGVSLLILHHPSSDNLV